jgi:translation initiation factor RLI1
VLKNKKLNAIWSQNTIQIVFKRSGNKNSLTGKLNKVKWNGIKNQAKTLIVNIHQGALKKIKILALAGYNNSLRNSFIASAIGCNNPKIPTTKGPRRLCTAPSILRSASVKNATIIKMHKIFNTLKKTITRGINKLECKLNKLTK